MKKDLIRTISVAALVFTTGVATVYADDSTTDTTTTSDITYTYIDGTTYTYNSQGILTITNASDSSQSVVIDTNDIYANEEALEELQSKLTGLGGGSLKYDTTKKVYYIDVDGNGVLDENTDTLIGAVGDATADKVLKGSTFSSAAAGVNVEGTIEIPTTATGNTYSDGGNDYLTGTSTLTEDGTSITLNANSDTGYNLNVGAGESVKLSSGYYAYDVTVNNGVKIPTTITGKTYSDGGNDCLAETYTLTEDGTSIALDTSAASTFNVGVGESITLPAGYYTYGVTVNNGVKDMGTLDEGDYTKTTDKDGKVTAVALKSGYYSGDATSLYSDGYSAGYSTGYTSGSAGTATADKVLEDYTFSSTAGVNIEGTMENVGAVTDSLIASSTWTAGYYSSNSVTKPTEITRNAYSESGGYLNGSSALTTETPLTLSSYYSSSNKQYDLNLGSGEQVTFPAGFYQYPINVSNKGTTTITKNYSINKLATPVGVSTYTLTSGYDILLIISLDVPSNVKASYSGSGTVVANNYKIGDDSTAYSVTIVKNATKGGVCTTQYWGLIYGINFNVTVS